MERVTAEVPAIARIPGKLDEYEVFIDVVVDRKIAARRRIVIVRFAKMNS